MTRPLTTRFVHRFDTFLGTLEFRQHRYENLEMCSPQKVKTPAQISTFDADGNEPTWWIDTANELQAAANVLRGAIEDAVEGDEADRTFWTRLMLEGFALENLLKALWLTKGETLYVNGNMVTWKGVRSHDLCAIAKHVGFPLPDRAEFEVITKLAKIIVTIGRYPLASKLNNDPGVLTWHSEDERALDSVRARLRGSIDGLLRNTGR